MPGSGRLEAVYLRRNGAPVGLRDDIRASDEGSIEEYRVQPPAGASVLRLVTYEDGEARGFELELPR